MQGCLHLALDLLVSLSVRLSFRGNHDRIKGSRCLRTTYYVGAEWAYSPNDPSEYRDLFSARSFDWHHRNALFGNGLLLLSAVCWSVSILYSRFYHWTSTPFQLVFGEALLAAILHNRVGRLRQVFHTSFDQGMQGRYLFGAQPRIERVVPASTPASLHCAFHSDAMHRAACQISLRSARAACRGAGLTIAPRARHA